MNFKITGKKIITYFSNLDLIENIIITKQKDESVSHFVILYTNGVILVDIKKQLINSGTRRKFFMKI